MFCNRYPYQVFKYESQSLMSNGLNDGSEDSSTEGELDDKTDGDIDCCNVG